MIKRRSAPGLPALAKAGTPRQDGVSGRGTRAVAASNASGRGASPGNQGVAPGIRGVALGSLASCVSDRQEDALKQRVLAVVGARRECASSAGRYRFVETRNLNAFLMWVERAPARDGGDRCDELAFAIECLSNIASGEFRNG